MPREQRQPGADLPGLEAPEPLTLADHVPPAAIVGDFVMELPGLVANMPGNVGELVGALSETLPHFEGQRQRQTDREAG